MKLRYTILYVENVGATLDFYEAAFGLAVSIRHPSGDFGTLDTGETILSFSSHALMTSLGKSPAAPDPARPTFEIAFETDDVAAAYERALAAGATPVQGAKKEEWGQTTAYVRDPNGFLVEICSPVPGQS